MNDARKPATGSRVTRVAAIVVALVLLAGLLHWLWVSDARQGRALEQRGAVVTRDWTRLGRPIVVVNLSTHSSNTLDKGIIRDDDVPLDELKGLADLQELYLSNSSAITDKTLARLPSLGLSQLRLLDIQLTGISGDGLKYVKELPTLRTLWLSGTKIDSGLGHLSGMQHLESLTLMQTDVSDAGLASLKDLPKLKSVDLVGTNVTDAGVSEFKKANPNAQVLR